MLEFRNTRVRLNYRGGPNQEQRMIEDKLYSLKQALKYSYQAQTLEFLDGRRYKCLINTDKTKGDYDNKVLSIPYEAKSLSPDVRSNPVKGIEQVEPTGIACGQVFKWVENKSHWLVYLQSLEETAYFRAEIRRCDQQIELEGRRYWAYVRGPSETTIQSFQKNKIVRNSNNYSLVAYITKDAFSMEKFHRFTKCTVYEGTNFDSLGKTWRVTVVNPYYADGIIELNLEEWYENTPERINAEVKQVIKDNTPIDWDMDVLEPEIIGPSSFPAFGDGTYEIRNTFGGKWYVEDGGKLIDLKENKMGVRVIDLLGKKRTIRLVYEVSNSKYYKEIMIRPI